MRLLDLFCGAGGAGRGYHRARFEIVGVDIVDQPHYPFGLIQAEATLFAWSVCETRGAFDAIHASPPCQTFTAYKRRGGGVGEGYEDLIAPTREALAATGLPYVIENVAGAPLVNPVMLCGSSFGLDIRRHRYFETNWPLVGPPCNHAWQTPRFPQATNRTNKRSTVEVGAYRCAHLAPAAMGIDWMTNDELSEAVPPAYTEFIGRQLMGYLRAKDAA